MTSTLPDVSEQDARIYKLIMHQLREARSTDKRISEIAKPIKHVLHSHIQVVMLAKLEELKDKNTDEQFGTTDFDGLAEDVLDLIGVLRAAKYLGKKEV